MNLPALSSSDEDRLSAAIDLQRTASRRTRRLLSVELALGLLLLLGYVAVGVRLDGQIRDKAAALAALDIRYGETAARLEATEASLRRATAAVDRASEEIKQGNYHSAGNVLEDAREEMRGASDGGQGEPGGLAEGIAARSRYETTGDAADFDAAERALKAVLVAGGAEPSAVQQMQAHYNLALLAKKAGSLKTTEPDAIEALEQREIEELELTIASMRHERALQRLVALRFADLGPKVAAELYEHVSKLPGFMSGPIRMPDDLMLALADRVVDVDLVLGDRAFPYFERLCAHDKVGGCYHLGRLLRARGELGRASELLDAACASGNLGACDGAALVEQDLAARDLAAEKRREAHNRFARAYKAFVRACDGGYLWGCLHQARSRRMGTGVATARSEAVAQARVVCDGGLPRACHQLGVWLRDDGEAEAALDAMRRGCDLGDTPACRALRSH